MYKEYSTFPLVNKRIEKELFATQEDFGSMCPTNWQEIAEALRREIGERCDAFIKVMDYDSIWGELDEICRDVWEDYCDGTLERTIPNFPKTIFED